MQIVSMAGWYNYWKKKLAPVLSKLTVFASIFLFCGLSFEIKIKIKINQVGVLVV